MDIFIKRGEEQFGPFSPEQVKEHLASGTLLESDLAWHSALPEWVSAGEVLTTTASAPAVEESAPTIPAPAPAAASGGGRKKILAVAGAVVLLGGGVAAAYFGGFIGGGEEPAEPTETNPPGPLASTGNPPAEENTGTPEVPEVGGGETANKTGGTPGTPPAPGGGVETPGRANPVANTEAPTPAVGVPGGESNTSFAAVTRKLDAGGTFFFYLSTQQAQDWVQTLFNEGGKLIEQMAPALGPDAPDAAKGVAIAKSVYDSTGLGAIDGIGASTKELADGKKRNVAIVHRDAAKGGGLLWEVLGKAPHDQAVLQLAPAETAYAVHSDVNLEAIISWVSNQIIVHAPEQAQQVMPMLQDDKVQSLLKSYGGEVGFYLTLDPNKTIAVPVGGPPMIEEGFPGEGPDVIEGIQLPPVPDVPENPGAVPPELDPPPAECDEPPVEAVPEPQPQVAPVPVEPQPVGLVAPQPIRAPQPAPPVAVPGVGGGAVPGGVPVPGVPVQPGIPGGPPPLPNGVPGGPGGGPLPPGAGGEVIQMPEPGLILVMKVKNNALQKELETLLDKMNLALEAVDQNGVAIMQAPQPLPLPTPFPIQPAMMQLGDHLIITSSPALAVKVAAVHQGTAPGLKGTPEFQQISKGMDLKGNQFTYVSGRVSKVFGGMLRQSLSGPGVPPLPEPVQGAMIKYMTMGMSEQLSVMQVTPEGFQLTSHTAGMGYDTVALVGAAVVPAAVAGALAFPLMARSVSEEASAAAQAAQKHNGGRMLATGLMQINQVEGKLPAADQWCDATLKHVLDLKFFVDPLFADPNAPDEKISTWFFNKHLAGVKLEDLADRRNTVLLFDGALNWNESGDQDDVFIEGDSLLVVMADGSTREVGEAELEELKWTP